MVPYSAQTARSRCVTSSVASSAADLAEHGVLQRVTLRLSRAFPVEGITVYLDDRQRLLRDLMEEEEVEARAVLLEPVLIFPL